MVTVNSSRAPPKGSHFQRGILFLGGKIGSSFRFVSKAAGVVTGVSVAYYYHQRYTVNEFFGKQLVLLSDEDGKKSLKPLKKVLVLPFDVLKLVEERKPGGEISSLLEKRNKQPSITLETKELVNIIHKAAADPNMTTLYADFGEGMRYPLEYAHIEEIRNAIRIFNESHRVHRNPNVDHNPVFAMPRNGDPKLSIAFGHTLCWREYFLASAFSNIYLQPRGHLNLNGTVLSNTFFRGMLDKYGIKAHIFKHGDFKTAPNAFSERGYTKSHLENVNSLTTSIDDTIRSFIQNDRALKFDQVTWKSISDYGSITASNAKAIGLICSLPTVTPLSFMIKANKDAKAKSKLDKIFGNEVCSSNFDAADEVSVLEYKQMLQKKEDLERIHTKINSTLTRLSELSTATSLLLSGFGVQTSSSKRDKIAVVTANGNIDGSLSYRVIQSIRKIRDDTQVKCLVLRINSGGGSVVSSEAILEELNTLEIPIVCSMGNYAASGGYYIATNSKRIFAQPTTITGSIGVFLVKFDATKWANSYGVRSDYHPHGSHSAASSPLTPLTPGMKSNLERLALNFYTYFKSIVADARSFTADEIENVAQGRVWTGEQAKEIGLVDALGGLDRAINYAKSAYTTTDCVTIEHWPKSKFTLADLPGLLMSGPNSADFSSTFDCIFQNRAIDQSIGDAILENLTQSKFIDRPHFLFAMDEKTAIEVILFGE